MALPGRCSYGDLGALCEFERLIDNPFRRDGAPRSVFLWRLGSNMFRIIGHTGRCRAGFPKHIAPRLSVRRCDLRFMQVLGSRRLRLLLGRLFPNPPPPEWHDITAAAQLPAPPPFLRWYQPGTPGKVAGRIHQKTLLTPAPPPGYTTSGG